MVVGQPRARSSAAAGGGQRGASELPAHPLAKVRHERSVLAFMTASARRGTMRRAGQLQAPGRPRGAREGRGVGDGADLLPAAAARRYILKVPWTSIGIGPT